MSEEPIGVETEGDKDINKTNFLISSETSQRIIDGLKLDGFQLGGGAVDFALGEYRRPHSDVDMIYVVDTVSWSDYVANPKAIPKERQSLQNITTEPELFGHIQEVPRVTEVQGAPVIRMSGPELPIFVDFVEAYRHKEGEREYIMLPIYEGRAFVKIPQEEVVTASIEGVETKTVSPEVLYLMKEQAKGIARTLSGGPPPDRRAKALKDMSELEEKIDKNKVEELKKRGVGFNFKAIPSIKFRVGKFAETLTS